MRKAVTIAAVALVLGASMPGRAGTGAPEAPVVEEILGVLRERGLLDGAEHDRLVARYQAQEADRARGLPRIRLSGDLRLRGDGSWYDEDGVADRSNRYRGRYRLRLAASADVNRWTTASLRVASSTGDNRSGNVSFGRPGPDFDYDALYLDQAFVELRAPEHWLPDGTSVAIDGGKQPNPFLWKSARDVLLWDNDIMPEGVAARGRSELAKGLHLFANAGYFVLDESASRSDPHLLGTQLGAVWESDAQPIVVGGRASWYGFRSLDGGFLERGIDGTGGVTNSGGNLPGLIDGAGDIDVGEIGAYATWNGFEAWPITLYAHLASNFSARSSSETPEAGAESLAWTVGLEIGDKEEWVELGVAYLHLEANAFPSQLVDSNFLDGVTNRRGLAFSSSRRILPNTDLNLSLFVSDAIEDALPDFADSVDGSQRLRLLTDLVVAF